MSEIQYSRFVVNEKPYCVWDWDITKHNLSFLNEIDPRYFEHIAKIHGEMLEGEDRQYAAIALRTAYSHSLETFFALLGAAIQAPECVVGWLLKYSNRQLFAIVRKIVNRQTLHSKLGIRPLTWETLSEKINSFNTGDSEKDSNTRASYARLWERFASDFLNENLDREYNSIKHGLRVSMGGFTITMGVEDEPGVPAPAENMRSFGGSEFGTKFYVPEQLVNPTNFRVKRKSLNWSPENLIYGLILTSMSIGNVTSFLKIVNGVDPSKVNFVCPSNQEHFEYPWKNTFSFTSFDMNTIIKESWIQPQTSQEILSVYTEDEQA